MGCFNVRCAYSGTEINSDDDVVIFFLKNNAFGDGLRGFRCYPHDAYNLLGPGIPAKYNEYGWYEFNEELTVAKIMQKVITKNWADTDDGDKRLRGNSKNELEVIRKEREDNVHVDDRTLLTWETIGDLIHDGDFDLENPMGSYNNGGTKVETYLHVMAVHADHYHDFLTLDLQYGWGDNKESYVDIIGKTWDKANNKTGIDKKVIKAIFDKQDQDPNYKTTDEENILISAYFREEAGIYHDDKLRFEFLDSKAPRHIEIAKQMDRDEFITTIYGMLAMHRQFSEHGRDYLPHGPGHQCHNFDLDIAYHEAVLKNLRKRAIAKGYDENGNYDEDYEDE